MDRKNTVQKCEIEFGIEPLQAVVKTNDPVLISFIEALFNEANVNYLILDHHMSIVEGSLGIIPRRILVPDDEERRARQILIDADLSHELETERP